MCSTYIVCYRSACLRWEFQWVPHGATVPGREGGRRQGRSYAWGALISMQCWGSPVWVFCQIQPSCKPQGDPEGKHQVPGVWAAPALPALGTAIFTGLGFIPFHTTGSGGLRPMFFIIMQIYVLIPNLFILWMWWEWILLFSSSGVLHR